ncbi:hypothetical protein G3I71_12850 [Streptomyces sp. SID12501]|uniref:Uncharacterized protein n=1 Tax=Streptomyces sp. SID12501 TaxID=2706042 RepID=A0A6B3BQQ3_9ACTN|nr:hypothetical protein [Streptomyces sp. SID12501]
MLASRGVVPARGSKDPGGRVLGFAADAFSSFGSAQPWPMVCTGTFGRMNCLPASVRRPSSAVRRRVWWRAYSASS